MSERDDYPAGVPCWVDALTTDPEGTVAFYTAIFGWESDDRAPAGSADPYYVCTLRGRPVAAIGRRPETSVSPHWNTYVRVDDIETVTAAALDAGGSVEVEPYEAHDGGRRAILADPAGARFGVWELGSGPGAELVNEPSAWAMSVLNTPVAADAVRFYRAVFGWTTSVFGAGGAELTMWHRAGYVGGEPDQPVPRDVVAVLAPLPDTDAAANWTVNFWVSDANAVTAKALDLGGSVIASPTDRPPFREGVIADPNGAPVAISQLLTGV
jgi:uncharacterized protein